MSANALVPCVAKSILDISRSFITRQYTQNNSYNFGQTLHSSTTLHISPSRASYGISFMRSWNKYDRDISRAHCILTLQGRQVIVLIEKGFQIPVPFKCWGMGLLPDTQYCRLRMRRECQERFSRHRGLAIPTCITALTWRTCRDACRDR